MSKFLLKPLFMICSFSRRLFCRINRDNRVLLVSCVDLLKMKFTISLNELRVDHRFLLLEMNIFLFQLEFSSTEAFTESTDLAKESNNSASGP